MTLLLLIVSIGSCDSGKDLIKLDSQTWNASYTKQDFKDRVLSNCIFSGIGDKTITEKFAMQDKSFYSPVVYILFDPVSEQILKSVIFKIKIDSLESLETVGEAAQGKNVFSECLKFYNSKKLDSISKDQLKAWAKIKNFDSLVHKAMPAY